MNGVKAFVITCFIIKGCRSTFIRQSFQNLKPDVLVQEEDRHRKARSAQQGQQDLSGSLLHHQGGRGLLVQEEDGDYLMIEPQLLDK